MSEYSNVNKGLIAVKTFSKILFIKRLNKNNVFLKIT